MWILWQSKTPPRWYEWPGAIDRWESRRGMRSKNPSSKHVNTGPVQGKEGTQRFNKGFPVLASNLGNGRAPEISPHLCCTLEKLPQSPETFLGDVTSVLNTVETISNHRRHLLLQSFCLWQTLWNGHGTSSCFPGKSNSNPRDEPFESQSTLEGELGPNLPTQLHPMEYSTPPYRKEMFLMKLWLRETSICCWYCESTFETTKMIL